MNNNTPREVIAYYRVSTQLQGIHGLGMAAQREAVRVYAERNGFPIVAAYDEVETGRKDDLKNRPALVAAVAHARRSGALLVIARIDRLARSVFVTSQLLASGVEFVACDNPHANRMTIQILAVMAEHEGRLISERTKAGLAAAKARGVVLGCSHHLDAAARRKGQLAAGESHKLRARLAYSDLVPTISIWCTEGATMAEMARRLNASGQCSQRRLPWSIPTIRRLLDREGLSSTYSFPGRSSNLTTEHRTRGVAASAIARRVRTAFTDRAVAGEVVSEYTGGRSCTEIADALNGRKASSNGHPHWTSAKLIRLLHRAGVEMRRGSGGITPAIQRLGTVAAIKARAAKRVAYRARLLPIVVAMRDHGLTYAEIATCLNRRGLRTSRGKRWCSAAAWCLVNR